MPPLSVLRAYLLIALTIALLAVPHAALAQGLPDLVIDGLTLTEVNNGMRLQVDFGVRNAGFADAGAFDVAIGGPGISEYRRFYSLAAGESVTVTLSMVRPAMPVFALSVTVIADPANTVPEADESNNYASAVLGIPALPPPL